MHFRVFYFFERSGDSISSASAVEMTARDIRERLLGRLHGQDDFLGILDAHDNLLQILCEPGGQRFWVELPVDAAKASYGRYMSMPELNELIDGLPQLFDREHIPGLQYRPW
jgi:hypothetical protein